MIVVRDFFYCRLLYLLCLLQYYFLIFNYFQLDFKLYFLHLTEKRVFFITDNDFLLLCLPIILIVIYLLIYNAISLIGLSLTQIYKLL